MAAIDEVCRQLHTLLKRRELMRADLTVLADGRLSLQLFDANGFHRFGIEAECDPWAGDRTASDALQAADATKGGEANG